MKIYRKFALLALVLSLAVSCGEEKDHSGDYGAIRVPDTRMLEQRVAADGTEADKEVTFTTEGPWTSTITSTRGDTPDWIAITPDHGDAAGSYTIRITLLRNNTGQARSAAIAIRCGTSRIEINVTQEGSDDPLEPEVDARISKIACSCQVEEHPEQNRATAVYRFEYDARGRIASYEWEDLEDQDDGPNKVFTFSYPDDKTLKLNAARNGTEERFTVALDNAGRAAEMRREGHSERWTFTYDAEGRCTRCEQHGIDEATVYPLSTFGWSEGDLVTFDTFAENGEKAAEYCYTLAYDKDFRNSAAMSLDLNALLFKANPGFISEFDVYGNLLAEIGRLGARSRHLTTTNLVEEVSPMWTDPDNPDLIYYYEILPGNVIIQWEPDNRDRISRAFCTTRVLCVAENRTTGRKDLVEEKCYTRRETYDITY